MHFVGGLAAMLRVAFATGALVASTAALAQYPAKPIRFIVPFPAGGSTDIAARAIAQPMSQALGQPVLVDNKPGADGLIAGALVAKSPPDGHTFLFATATGMSYAPVTRKSMPYDPIGDFTPVGRIGYFGFFMYVHESVPARTVPDLIAYARANPGQLNFGSTSATSLVAATQFGQGARIAMAHIPYKGDAPLLADLVSGRVQLSFAAGAGLPHVREGKLRALGTMLPSRSPLLPEVPTLAESGITSVSITPWAGLFGPAGLPRDITERISRELSSALARADVQEVLAGLAFEGRGSTPEELGALVQEQLATWRRAVQAAGIQVE
jgi:tripartite-type tricarboxylate transporter receptor subunit TctC